MRKIGIAALALGMAALVGCSSTPPGQVGGTGGGSGQGSAHDGVLTLSAQWETTYAQNWNPFNSTTSGPGGQWVYEELVRVRLADGTVQPWLAESWTFSADGKVVTFHLQPKATWADGKPVTADDVVYSLELPLKHPELNGGGAEYTKVEKIDDKTIKVHWDKPAYTRLIDLYYPRVIVPAHIYGKVDVKKYLDKKPVGSGPAVLESFSPQQVVFKVRDDYWNGPFEVKKLRWKVSSASSAQGLMTTGAIDVTAELANIKQFVNTDPANNKLFLQADGFVEAVQFNTAAPPFNDVHLRKAFAAGTSIGPIKKLAEVTMPRTFPPASLSGLNTAVYKDIIPQKYLGRSEQADTGAVKAALRAGGYTVADGKLLKDGKQVELEYQVNLATPDAKNFGNMLIQQWKKNIGVDVRLATLPEDLYQAATRKGDFQMISEGMGTGRGLYWSYRNTFGKALLKPLGTEADANKGRFDDPVFEKLLQDYANTKDEAELRRLAGAIQDRFVARQPAIPLMSGGGKLVINAKKWKGWPSDSNLDHVPSIGIGPDFILTMKDLKPAGN